VLGIFRVHGLALIRRFLLAERDLLTFPDLPPCLPKFVARMQRCRCAFARCGSGELGRLQRGASLTA
jgi:hypothetical protein